MYTHDLVRYIRAHPGDAHLIFKVAATMDDDDGSWIMLVEENEENPDAEVAPGIMGGFGCWEEAKEFEVVS
jgi:hypothetical protein